MPNFEQIKLQQELEKGDYNISPSRYIQITDDETYWPIGKLVEELSTLEEEATAIDTELKTIFEKLGI
ncbi:MAG: hypothetical protein K0B11_08510 [Mariniphaga sp.]|nr:hypothetical protein [Mariniphaga sp.]